MLHILFILLFFSKIYSSDIKILLIEDSSLIKKLTFRAVENYNKTADQKIQITHIDDGQALSLEMLEGVHLVLCDTKMGRENGDQTLARMLREVAEITENILCNSRLPPGRTHLNF